MVGADEGAFGSNEEWATGRNDPGYTGADYVRLQKAVDVIGELGDKIFAYHGDWKKGTQARDILKEWKDAAFGFAAHCRDAYSYHEGKAAYHEDGSHQAALKEARVRSNLLTQILGARFLIASHDLHALPVDEGDKALGEIKYLATDVDHEIIVVCESHLKNAHRHMSHVLKAFSELAPPNSPGRH